jgi:hypothetical protein
MRIYFVVYERAAPQGSKRYVGNGVIVKRWEDFTGNTAVCEPSAAHFEQELDV